MENFKEMHTALDALRKEYEEKRKELETKRRQLHDWYHQERTKIREQFRNPKPEAETQEPAVPAEESAE